MLPALPLDGGRALRALLWRAGNDFAWATNVAASIGRGFGYLFIGGGVGLLIFQGAFIGAWLAFVGWFLLGAATAEQRYLAARQALSGLRVADLMTADPDTVPRRPQPGHVHRRHRLGSGATPPIQCSTAASSPGCWRSAVSRPSRATSGTRAACAAA